MRSIVCLKRVPDTETRIRIAPDGAAIDAAGVKYVVNPYDEFALEEGIRLREAAGGGRVTALTVGPEEAKEQLRAALAVGADDAVLLRGSPAWDGLSVARVIAAEVAEREFDLLLFGKQAIDDDNMQVPAMVAELLELPCATVVVDLRIEGRSVVARREVEGGHEVLEFELPAVVAAQKGLNEPRYPKLQGIMAAKKKPLEEKEVTLPEPKLRLLGLSEPPARPPGRVVGEGPDAVPELVRLLRDEAKVL